MLHLQYSKFEGVSQTDLLPSIGVCRRSGDYGTVWLSARPYSYATTTTFPLIPAGARLWRRLNYSSRSKLERNSRKQKLMTAVLPLSKHPRVEVLEGDLAAEDLQRSLWLPQPLGVHRNWVVCSPAVCRS